jgi:hypothetical protein
VNALINGPTHTAIDGDTINIPAGTCTWASQLSVTKGISIIGAGSSSTIIQDGYAGGTLFSIRLGSSSQTFRLSGISLSPGGAGPGANPSLASIVGTCDANTCSHIRLDHISSTGWVDGTNFHSFLMGADAVFGVIDHWTVIYNSGGEFIGLAQNSFRGVGANGDNSWAQPDFYGTDNFIYIEDSSFTSTASQGMAITDTDIAGGGGRFVGRFNTMHNANYQTHGSESSGRGRSGRVYEIYNNNLTLDSGADNTFMGWRGGTGLFFNNTKSGAGNMYLGASLTNYREGNSFWPWGTCNGQGPYDQNDGVVYASGTLTAVNNSTNTWTDSTKSWTANQWSAGGYSFVDITLTGTNSNGPVQYHPGGSISSNTSNTFTSSVYNSKGNFNEPALNVGDSYQILRATGCADAPGRGGAGAVLLSDYNNPAPQGWVNQPLDPVYEWGDTASGPVGPWIGPNTVSNIRIVQNRDYYQQVSPFTGATGTGTGTLASRPATCTKGVAYWATDQGNWNQSGNGGQGQLYVCASPNTWTLSYTPYIYPHPLTGGAITTPPAPPAPSRPIAPSSLQTVVR